MGFASVEEIETRAKEQECQLWETILHDDMTERQVDRLESIGKMSSMYLAMKDANESYDKDLKSQSGLSGGDGEKMMEEVRKMQNLTGEFVGTVMANALKMGESNACMKRIVAAGVGQVIAERACIAGAQGGCQAEIGSASCMAATAITYIRGGSTKQIFDAGAFALKSLLGLVCDPLGGLVEVPCIKRNVIGSVNAITASDMAMAGIESKVPLDEVIDAMAEVGDLLPCSLKETSQAGLAQTETGKKYMIEVCCGSFEDAMMASECGIKRVELNSALSLGGLTPSLGSLIMIKQYSDIEIVSMVRARAGGFCYTNYQYEQMLENLKLLLAYGTDGVSFGFLNEDRTIDKNRCQEFLENVKNEGRKATFHRAFDCTRDPYEAIETLIDLGFDRLLTSGQEATAEEGIHLLADLQKKYGNQIEIIAGCGVNENNAQKIIDKTGIKQLHSTCRGWGVDATGMGERVSFQVSDEDGDRYRSVSVDRIKKFVQICG